LEKQQGPGPTGSYGSMCPNLILGFQNVCRGALSSRGIPEAVVLKKSYANAGT
jgi:hypothetical protein